MINLNVRGRGLGVVGEWGKEEVQPVQYTSRQRSMMKQSVANTESEASDGSDEWDSEVDSGDHSEP